MVTDTEQSYAVNKQFPTFFESFKLIRNYKYFFHTQAQLHEINLINDKSTNNRQILMDLSKPHLLYASMSRH